MKHKTASIISYIAVLVIAVLFFRATLGFPAQESYEGVYKSPAYYPQLLCILIMLAAGVGLIVEIFLKRGEEGQAVRIENWRNYLLIIGVSCAAALVWQTYELFYLASFLCLGTLFFSFDPRESVRRKLSGAIVFSACSTAVIYLCFELLLEVPL